MPDFPILQTLGGIQQNYSSVTGITEPPAILVLENAELEQFIDQHKIIIRSEKHSLTFVTGEYCNIGTIPLLNWMDYRIMLKYERTMER